MKEETLNEIRREVKELKRKNEEINRKSRRIQELEQDIKVREYLRLRGVKEIRIKEHLETDEDTLVTKVYYKHLRNINENDTNKIYAYLGTYKSSYETDIEHGSSDIRVDYLDPKAEYRIFQDLEQDTQITIPISKCIEFESTHKIIYLKGYRLWGKYYNIQKEFFTVSVKSNQEKASELILRKYNSNSK